MDHLDGGPGGPGPGGGSPPSAGMHRPRYSSPPAAHLHPPVPGPVSGGDVGEYQLFSGQLMCESSMGLGSTRVRDLIVFGE